jgi:hypothetical protein
MMTAQTTSEARTDRIRIIHDFHIGISVRLTIWNGFSRDLTSLVAAFVVVILLTLLFFGIQVGHHQTDLFLRDRASVNDAVELAAAEDCDTVAQREQNIQILADIDHGDALFLLLIQKPIDGV